MLKILLFFSVIYIRMFNDDKFVVIAPNIPFHIALNSVSDSGKSHWTSTVAYDKD